MVPVLSLWAPILLSAVLVFVASSLVHMVLGYHRADYRRLPKEDEVMEALRRFDIPPGDYLIPCAGGPSAMKDPVFLERFKRGPVAMMTVMKGGSLNMGPSLLKWFVYCVAVGVFAAYVSGLALPHGAPYRPVFRIASCTAFIGYALALWQDSIWYHRAWGTTLRYTLDGLIFALLTGGAFGWLWPR